MLIPSIDLKGGKVVQLVQGDRVAIEQTDVFRWVRRFQGFPIVQLIDLDAAMGTGNNDELVKKVSAKLACQVGGGIRSVERAEQVIAAGARKVILGSALFKEGHPDLGFAAKVCESVGRERVIAAVDTRGGRLVIHGWRTTLAITPIEAMKALEPYCDEFLYTDVDHEGLMQGMDIEGVKAIRAATGRRLTAAGGITTQEEVDLLDSLQINAVVGMAIYTGTLQIAPPKTAEVTAVGAKPEAKRKPSSK
jgi:phosphoribosylformimino-5-aminoimidazole carboxamide ribotide isomerase